MRDQGEGGGRVSGRGEREEGNRGVSPPLLFDGCGDLSGGTVEANTPEEVGSRGNHGFPRASEPKAGELAA
jgi:hypothetical protein